MSGASAGKIWKLGIMQQGGTGSIQKHTHSRGWWRLRLAVSWGSAGGQPEHLHMAPPWSLSAWVSLGLLTAWQRQLGSKSKWCKTTSQKHYHLHGHFLEGTELNSTVPMSLSSVAGKVITPLRGPYPNPQTSDHITLPGQGALQMWLS